MPERKSLLCSCGASLSICLELSNDAWARELAAFVTAHNGDDHHLRASVLSTVTTEETEPA